MFWSSDEKGYRVTQQAVPGHEFGPQLKPGEGTNWIAFLRTL